MSDGPLVTQERWSPDGLERLRTEYEPLRRFAAVIGRYDVEPDDLVQEAFARVLRRDEMLIDDLGPYLRRTVANLATDERRRVHRRDAAVTRLHSDVSAGNADSYPSELADLMRLPAKVRALLYLVEVDGHQIAEAAVVVDMSPTAARVALMRARRRLRMELTVEMRGE